MAEGGINLSSAESSDREGDTFEDAPDSASRPQSRTSGSGRSLTDRPQSSSSTRTPRVSTQTPAPIDEVTAEGQSVSPLEATADPVRASPLLTSRRLSTSSLDEVQLDNGQDGNSPRSRSTTITSNESLQNLVPQPPKLPSRPQGLSGDLPSVPWSPPPPPPPALSKKELPAPAAPPRKLGMSFSWLSRSVSAKQEAASAPMQTTNSQPGRRNTANMTTSSNPELMLRRLDESNDQADTTNQSQGKTRNSLRDRFKMLRMSEEAGIHSLEGQDSGSPTRGGALAGLIGRSATVSLGIGSPTSIADEKERGLPVSPAQSPDSSMPPSNLTSPIDESLAPGTVSGASAGPSALNDPAASVDWDLWQSVVYEGPSAVARTSAEELNRAISGGIPSAIRGVVWQVLAQSKNEELEGVYRELVARGTDKDKDRELAATSIGSNPKAVNASSKEKAAITSSSSSIHSNHSTPATSAANGMNSPVPSQNEKDSENASKLHAAMLAERKKKTKEDAAALQKLEKAIKRDLGARTSFSKYAAAAGLQDGLFGVCKAYALFDEGVGYAQGMNILIMPLLFNMPEEEAFCLLVRLMNHYHLRDMFVQDMPGLHRCLYQFERLLEDLEPALYCHLHRKDVSPQLYATQWFLTFFAYRFPLQLVLRVYDLVLSEGLEGAILKFGITLMQKNSQVLLGMSDMASLSTFLKERLFDVYIDRAPSANSLLESGFFGSSSGIDKEVYRADLLVQDACAVKITPDLLAIYNAEWDQKVRTEKEREAEIDTLRSANASLALKVRSLEERIEKSDTEHVQMASELIRTKVENQELLDKSDSLQGQVKELRNVVERQPEEVEQRLREEMDRIMKRNLEVQNENRGLEDQMAEMEKTLVETKMDYALIQSEYETLKQKWNDLRRAIA
ncbi:MAG: hypothetical protein LQ351_001685 [Letrouitia transgressa]|nr:MAG: hypothetical protein LQ351_001685 [Letrouitia transgressa]